MQKSQVRREHGQHNKLKGGKGWVVNNPVQGEAGKTASCLSSFIFIMRQREPLEGSEQEWEMGSGGGMTIR